MRIRKRIEDYKEIPHWYGTAWYDYRRRLNVCYPIPINVVMRIAYLCYGWLVFPIRSETWWEKRQNEIILECHKKHQEMVAYNRRMTMRAL